MFRKQKKSKNTLNRLNEVFINKMTPFGLNCPNGVIK